MATSLKEKLLWDDPKFSQRSGSIEAVTAVYARHMLAQSGLDQVPKGDPLVILDNACGNGIVTQEIQDIFQTRPKVTFEVTCGDLADAMITAANERVASSGWSNTKVIKLDAQDTKLPSNNFTHVYTNFGVMLVPRPGDMLKECHRILKTNGMCAFTTWKRVGWIEDIVSAMNSVPGIPRITASASELAKGYYAGNWDEEQYIRDMMAKHGFKSVEIKVIENTSVISSKDEIQRIAAVCTSMITRKYWTQEQQSQFDNHVLQEGVDKWLEQKYQGQPLEWQWAALVTTCRKG